MVVAANETKLDSEFANNHDNGFSSSQDDHGRLACGVCFISGARCIGSASLEPRGRVRDSHQWHPSRRYFRIKPPV